MTKHLLFVIVCTTILGMLSADTIPGGDVSGTWYAANSPYYITGDITIPADSTLIIEPGVEVEFQGNYSLVVNGGYLEAIGTEVDSIHFFPADTNARWDGIGFSSAPDSSHMDYCTVQYATFDGLRAGGGIDCSNSNPVISHCAISHCDGLWGGGIYFNNFNGSISYCTIIGNQSLWRGGGIYLNNSSLLLSHCTISDNSSAIEAGGIYGNNSNQIFLDCIISGNTTTENGGGIYNYSGSLSLTGCEISDNYAAKGAGIYFGNNIATLTSCAFSNNESGAWDAGGAVHCHSGTYSFSYCTFNGDFGSGAGGIYLIAYAAVDHCTFNDLSSVVASDIFVEAGSASVSNCIHSKLNPMGDYAFYGVDDVTYSDFYGNCSNIWGGPAGFGELIQVNINGDSCDVYFNIFMDPMFVDSAGGDLHLTENSPCIDAGDPASPYDPDSTITDMGRYYFDQTGIAERLITKYVEHAYTGATIFKGPLVLPEGKTCRVFDITGREIKTLNPAPGIYFLEIDGDMAQKIVKVR